MKDEHAVPKFIKPGDNPELDRIIAELKAEPPPVGRGADIFGRPYRRPGAAAEGKPAETKPAEAKPATDAAVVSRPRSRGKWVALAAVAIVGPIVALALGSLRTRGPSVVLAPVNMTSVERTAPAAPVMSVPVPVMSATASASASPAEMPSATPVQRPSTNKKRPQPQAADAGAARPAVPSDFLE